MDLKEFAAHAIKMAEDLYEKKQYAQAVAKLEILKLEIERNIKSIEKVAARIPDSLHKS